MNSVVAAVMALMLAQSTSMRPRANDRVNWRLRAYQRGSTLGPYSPPIYYSSFEFAPASKRGLSVNGPNLCNQLSLTEKTGEYWCINGSTVDPASTVTMTRQGTAFEEVNIKQCTGALDCYDVVGLRATQTQAGGGGPFFKSAVLGGRNTTTSTPYTACAWVNHGFADGMYIAFGDESDTGDRRFLVGESQATALTQRAEMAQTGACGTGNVETGTYNTLPAIDSLILDEGTLILVCSVYDGVSGYLRHSYGTTAGVAVGPHCAGGANARFLYGGMATVAVDGTNLTRGMYLYGGFYVPQALSLARIQQISTAMFGNDIQSENGQMLVNARSTQMSCSTADGQYMTQLLPGQTCATSGGVYKRREGRNYWSDGARIAPGYGYGFINAGRFGNTNISPDMIREADTVFLDAGTDSRIWKTTTTDTCPTGMPAVLSYFVKGLVMDGGIRAGVDDAVASFPTTCTDVCSYNTTQWTRCKHAIPSLPDPHKVSIGQFTDGGVGCPSTGLTTAANSVLIWGIQCEPDFGGGLATAYIPATFISTYKTHTADKPYFIVPEAYTSPLAMSAKWIAPPVSISLGDVAGNTNSPPYLLALEKDGGVRNSLAFKWQTAEYNSGSTSPITLATELSAQTGEIKFRGENTDAGLSTVTLGPDTVGPFLGGGTSQTYDTVNLGWSTTNLNFEGVITEVCIKSDGGC